MLLLLLLFHVVLATGKEGSLREREREMWRGRKIVIQVSKGRQSDDIVGREEEYKGGL